MALHAEGRRPATLQEMRALASPVRLRILRLTLDSALNNKDIAAAFRLACEQAGVPMQTFVSRSDLPCGSTVGPFTSSLTEATTVDFGDAALSLHSAREPRAANDPERSAAPLARVHAPT